MSLSLAWLGFALGRTRFMTSRSPSVLVLAACWFVGGASHQVLGYWGQYLVVLLGLPGATAPWIGPLVFAFAASVLMLSTDPGGAEAPPSSGQRAVPA